MSNKAQRVEINLGNVENLQAEITRHYQDGVRAFDLSGEYTPPKKQERPQPLLYIPPELGGIALYGHNEAILNGRGVAQNVLSVCGADFYAKGLAIKGGEAREQNVFLGERHGFRKSLGCGGGLLATGGARVALENCDITDNCAQADGGAIAAFGGDVVLRECVVFANHAKGRGGAVSVKLGISNPTAKLWARSTEFIGNTSAVPRRKSRRKQVPVDKRHDEQIHLNSGTEAIFLRSYFLGNNQPIRRVPPARVLSLDTTYEK